MEQARRSSLLMMMRMLIFSFTPVVQLFTTVYHLLLTDQKALRSSPSRRAHPNSIKGMPLSPLPVPREHQHGNLSQGLTLTSRPQPHIAAHTSCPHCKRVQQHSATVQPQRPQLARARHQQFRGLCLLLPAGAAPVCPPRPLAGQNTEISSKSMH